jgi:hypothetical protein
MLAVAICLEQYMKDLLALTRNVIEQDWLACWRDPLGNPDSTPCQVLRAYVEELNIAVARLGKAMDWECWENKDDKAHDT